MLRLQKRRNIAMARGLESAGRMARAQKGQNERVVEHLRGLQETLPPPQAALSAGDMNERARAVLAMLIERALEASPLDPVPADPHTCPNCGKPATALKTPYCSECCKGVAAFVRQLRSALKAGSILDPERQSGMGQALWRELGAGHPHRQSLLDEKAIARVFKRDNGQCQVCGAEATTIDHIGSG
jgi:hypothetical protein